MYVDRISFEKILLVITCTLIFMIGLIMIFNTTSAEVLDLSLPRSTYFAVTRQLYYAVLGLVLAGFLYRFGVKNFLTASPYLLAFFCFLLLLTLVPGIGREVNGAKRWISVFGFSLQPSEFVKFLLPAVLIHRMGASTPPFTYKTFLKVTLPLFVPIVLILLQPNNGTALVLVFILIMLLFVMGTPVKYWGLPIAGALLIGGVFAYQLPYVQARLKVYWNPELDRLGRGHQPYQAKIAAGSGGWLGKGPGNSFQKLSYLPEAQNDYIAAIYAEECGFLGMLLLITLYMLFTLLGFWLSCRAVTRDGFLLAASITSLISLQAFLNLAVVSGLLPSTGLNLPLFSQGGSSLAANLLGITLLSRVAVE